MRFSATAIAAVLLIAEVSASAITPHHVKLARKSNRQKRCAARPHNSTNDSNDFNIQNNQSSSSVPTTTITTSQTPAPSSPPPPPPPPPPPVFNSGVIQVPDNACGPSGATPDTSAHTGPNGSIDFINCGIEGGGWQPPAITLENVISQSLRNVISWQNSPFAPCAPYVDAFESIGNQIGIPPILLASIAMQESSCNPGVTGRNGEIGMMQITPDKCSGDCYDFYNNINIGANYFRNVYDGVHNLPAAMGMYNGWFIGMTEFDANNKCCSCRNNLDYLHNVLNGFMQGIDPSSRGMGKYFNLQSC